MSGISIRLATEDDAGTIHDMIVALAESLGDERNVVSTADDIRKHGFAQDPAFCTLLAWQDDEPVGMCLFFYSFSTWLGTLGVYIQDLYVDDRARGTGLGRMLVAETARIAAARGADHMRLAVGRENSGARAFYEQLGMRHRNDECIYQADGDVFAELAAAGDNA